MLVKIRRNSKLPLAVKTQPLDSQKAEGIMAKALKPKVSCERPVWPEPGLRKGETCLLTARCPSRKPTFCWRKNLETHEWTGDGMVGR